MKLRSPSSNGIPEIFATYFWLRCRLECDFMSEILTTGPMAAPAHLLLAHGAGAAMTSPFLEKIDRA